MFYLLLAILGFACSTLGAQELGVSDIGPDTCNQDRSKLGKWYAEQLILKLMNQINHKPSKSCFNYLGL